MDRAGREKDQVQDWLIEDLEGLGQIEQELKTVQKAVDLVLKDLLALEKDRALGQEKDQKDRTFQKKDRKGQTNQKDRTYRMKDLKGRVKGQRRGLAQGHHQDLHSFSALRAWGPEGLEGPEMAVP
mmetsp:Transcript_64505/g.151563  ORF Transcript_64505/g.151563 Transcript_64505/m.151563 type:complete len:126 (+) Transcript_64505:604-981(+)